MNILIVEDDPFVCRDIIEKLKTIGYSKINTSSNYHSAIKAIEKGYPDVVLLDIDLGEQKNGIDLGNYLLSKNIPFIYLSDLQDPASFERAKQTKPLTNLEKPVSTITLRNSLSLALQSSQKPPVSKKFVVVPSGSKKIKIDLNSIIYLKAAKNNCEIHLKSEKPKRHLSSTPMGNVLKVLNDTKFSQVHRSYVVNLEHVHAYQGSRVFMNKELTIEIPISPSYLSSFKSRFEAI